MICWYPVSCYLRQPMIQIIHTSMHLDKNKSSKLLCAEHEPVTLIVAHRLQPVSPVSPA